MAGKGRGKTRKLPSSILRPNRDLATVASLSSRISSTAMICSCQRSLLGLLSRSYCDRNIAARGTPRASLIGPLATAYLYDCTV